LVSSSVARAVAAWRTRSQVKEILISQADGRLFAREADMMWDRSIRTVEWLMNEVSLLRLYILRAVYLFIVVGLGVYLWPGVLKLDKHWEEVLWKTLWLTLVPLPQWMSGHVDESIKPTIFAVSLVLLVYLAIPWRYVFVHYVRLGGDRWGPRRAGAAG
jgi:hypothetical protein